ncbi:MAG: ribonuclease H [Lentisphaerota bacterium]
MNEIILYADGACRSNPGPGGYGVVLLADGQRREFSGGFRKTTNNRMELFSVIRGLREVAPLNSLVTIYSDAQYVVNMYNGGYARQWRSNGWTRNKGKDPALNPDLWGALLDLCALHQVRFVWVKGHSDNKENARCDELAVSARQEKDLPIDAGYERTAAPEPPRQLELFGG